jgi:hypothetical protein
MKISHSKTEAYTLCPLKYKFQYVDKLSIDKTFTPLLFGAAVDRALNYVLIRKKRRHAVSIDVAKKIFLKHMNTWTGNELVYFKNEAPVGIEHIPDDKKQTYVWEHLCKVGQAMLQTYYDEILPMFAEILSVQTRREIPNDVGDTLILITDFTARLHDGRVVVFDNKTTTDLKRNYGPTSVAKSQQLAIYTEFEESKLAGYIALSKKLKDDGTASWTHVIDTVPEEQVEAAFNKVDTALRGIKSESFPPNEKACFSFGRKCEFYNLCKYNNDSGIIYTKENKK